MTRHTTDTTPTTAHTAALLLLFLSCHCTHSSFIFTFSLFGFASITLANLLVFHHVWTLHNNQLTLREQGSILLFVHSEFVHVLSKNQVLTAAASAKKKKNGLCGGVQKQNVGPKRKIIQAW